MKSVEVLLALGFGSGGRQGEAASCTAPAAFLLPGHTHPASYLLMAVSRCPSPIDLSTRPRVPLPAV